MKMNIGMVKVYKVRASLASYLTYTYIRVVLIERGEQKVISSQRLGRLIYLARQLKRSRHLAEFNAVMGWLLRELRSRCCEDMWMVHKRFTRLYYEKKRVDQAEVEQPYVPGVQEYDDLVCVEYWAGGDRLNRETYQRIFAPSGLIRQDDIRDNELRVRERNYEHKSAPRGTVANPQRLPGNPEKFKEEIRNIFKDFGCQHAPNI